MKESFAYVLECMLTFDKMKKNSPLMCTKFESFSYFTHSSVYRVFWPSGRVVHIDCNILILFRHSTVSVLWLFLTVTLVSLRCETVVFSDHTHLFFVKCRTVNLAHHRNS